MPNTSYYSDDYFWDKIRSSNKKVKGKYIANTVYQFHTGRVYPTVGTPYRRYYATTADLNPPAISTATNNKLYGKLREELIGPKGELLTSAFEWRSSLDMVSGRARQLGTAYLAVRRFQFKKAASILRIATPSKFKNLTKKQAQKKKLAPTAIWLEYWMGWAPLCGDIAHAIDTMGKDPASIRHFRVGVTQDDSYNKVIVGYYGGPKDYARRTVAMSGKSRFAAYGDVVAVNHNYNIATKLGFINPALTLWQVVPFSFIVDWFANVSTVLGSLTDFSSLSFANTGSARKFEGSITSDEIEENGLYGVTRKCRCSASRLLLSRTPGSLPTPRLNVVMLDRLSLTRAATSISLLTEIFLRK